MKKIFVPLATTLFFTLVASAESAAVNDKDLVSAAERMKPLIVDSLYSGIEFKEALEFSDDFSGGPTIDKSNWRYERLDGPNGQQHRVPYVPDNEYQNFGRRHSAFYSDFEEVNNSLVDGKLRQRAFIERGFNIDPARNDSYSDPDGAGEEPNNNINFGNFKLYGAWIDTFAYDQKDSTNWVKKPILPPEAPNKTFLPGTYFEIRVNFSHMKMHGHRHSFWLMPATDGEGNIPVSGQTYDGVPENGLEIDIYEHEHSTNANINDMLFMKSINGNTGDDTTMNDFTSIPGISLQGDHRTDVVVSGIHDNWTTIGLLWTESELVWFVNGKAVVRDNDLVPQVPMYMILSRELNSGVKSLSELGGDSIDVYANGEDDDKNLTRPKDPGLTAVNVGTKDNLSKIDNDYVEVDYIRVWSVDGRNNDDDGLASPTGLTGNVYSQTSAEIIWDRNPASDDFVMYQIKRNGIIVATKDALSHYDDTLLPGTKYTYEVKAVQLDSQGNVTNESPIVVYALTTNN